MPVRAIPALPAVALCAASFFMLAPTIAANADTCLAKPDAPAPQGARWYYRTERPSMRKCWRLVGKDQKEIKPARAAAQPEPDDETGSVTATQASAPVAPAAEPPAKPAPVVTTLVTRNVSNTPEVAQLNVDPPAEIVPAAPPAAAAPQAATAETPAVAAELPAQAVIPPEPAASAAPVPEAGPSFTAYLIAGVLFAFFACAAVLLLALARRRSTDVLQAIRAREQQLPFEPSPEMSPSAPANEEPSFSPIPPMVRPVHLDDVDGALQEFAVRRQRRRAA
jgi:hypothetical protein